MKKLILSLVLLVLSTAIPVYAIEVDPAKDGNTIKGHIIEKNTEEDLPFATILIVETGQGMAADETGHFAFKNIPAGDYTLRVQLVGFLTQEKKVTVSNEFGVNLHFEMEEDNVMMDEVVVSANRNEVSRKEAPVVVNVMSAKLFEMVNSTDLAKSLNF